MAGIKVSASNARQTSTGVDGGVDVDFEIESAEFPEGPHEGEVTLVRHEITGRFGRWGSLDHWLDGRSVAMILSLPKESQSMILDDVTNVCAALADRFAGVSP
jgi:hypothetical protein